MPTANANADALLDRVAGVETGLTVRQALRLLVGAFAGRLSGAGTGTETVRDYNNSKNRLIYTVDVNGNRTGVTTDVT